MKRLSSIRAGAMSRGFALAKVSMSAGAKAASFAIGNVFGGTELEKAERFKKMLVSQAGMLAQELGQLKGSVMKMGQLLSTYGERLLPPEVNALLKALQSQSPPLEWKAIEAVLLRELGTDRLALLEIEPEALASASLGQVHRARRKSDGKELAIKIQYPGVDRAIESDLKSLRSLLTMSKLLPKGPKYDAVFEEVKEMLYQEVDYLRELELTNEFARLLASDRRFVVPETFPEFSTGRVLTTSFEEGVAVDGPEVRSLSQQRRNQLGTAILDLYFTEVFRWGKVQTDPHFGNYRIRIDASAQNDRWVLFDFGAVRIFENKFLESYRDLVKSAYRSDPSSLTKSGMDLGFLKQEDSSESIRLFYELCQMITEPFRSGTSFAWAESELPRLVIKKGSELAFTWNFRSPPREVVFLDRKMGGVFIVLSALRVRIDSGSVLERFLL